MDGYITVEELESKYKKEVAQVAIDLYMTHSNVIRYFKINYGKFFIAKGRILLSVKVLIEFRLD